MRKYWPILVWDGILAETFQSCGVRKILFLVLVYVELSIAEIYFCSLMIVGVARDSDRYGEDGAQGGIFG